MTLQIVSRTNLAIINKRRPLLAIVFSCLTLFVVANGACAQANLDEDFDDVTKPWQEIALQLPAAPQAADRIEFYVSPTATQKFAIDGKSVVIGADGVIRYTLIAISSNGAQNISYQGLRCASSESKQYAFGHTDGSWSRARSDKWQSISSTSHNRYAAALAGDYFCDGNTIAGDAPQLVDRVKNQRTLRQKLGP